ncbi:metal-dependent hydrolase [Flammeovirga kamogawensis]|uniref:Metal-dependent hydrolase n=1 Tax=Flammeovirga kamogawensis TaxID=373891 RepID=A0ABX8GXJ2_9BACT|nr:metal-dependent hydrolase [Flammeovirga kamogawensis]MBB6460917.1 L-ascorbate metabolism protein UlaG (beta-lactamase superfamily) [Flammeovirga kamogawensis]QWG08261.1 metal-dependent hydrolase [Flammeovirga kamogawensis]TRX70064.1 metal-dependent hydrolase [Flammeovirga kamogawensis]
MKIKFLGHASLLIEFGGKNLLVDPFITPNELAKDIDINTLDVDYILVTHGHQDHVVDVEAIASRTKAPIISNFEIVSYYGEKGLEGHPMNHGGKFTFDFGTIKYVNAIHSSVLPDGTYAGNPGGFVIWNEKESIYIAGDTALTMDMQLIPKTCPKLDIAILPVGDNFTMGYEDAVIAAEYIECDTIIGYHFDTFPPIKIDHEQAIALFKSKGKNLILPNVGQTI